MRPWLTSIAPDAHFEELTTTGPYAGILEAFTTGVKLSTRYTHLKGKITNAKTLLWATDSSRVIETAKYFAAGFFGLESKLVEVVVIPKDETRGADVLSPGYVLVIDRCSHTHTEQEQLPKVP